MTGEQWVWHDESEPIQDATRSHALATPWQEGSERGAKSSMNGLRTGLERSRVVDDRARGAVLAGCADDRICNPRALGRSRTTASIMCSTRPSCGAARQLEPEA